MYENAMQHRCFYRFYSVSECHSVSDSLSRTGFVAGEAVPSKKCYFPIILFPNHFSWAGFVAGGAAPSKNCYFPIIVFPNHFSRAGFVACGAAPLRDLNEGW